jgi:hypothetical protein
VDCRYDQIRAETTRTTEGSTSTNPRPDGLSLYDHGAHTGDSMMITIEPANTMEPLPRVQNMPRTAVAIRQTDDPAGVRQ